MLGLARLKVNWKLLISPSLCDQIWFGAQYRFSPGAPFLFTQPVSLIPSPAQGLVGMWRAALKWWVLFPSAVLRWLFPVYVNELGRDSCWMRSLGGMVQMWKQRLSSQLETASFKVLQLNHGPWRAFLDVSFVMRVAVWFGRGKRVISKNQTALANSRSVDLNRFCPDSWLVSLQTQFRINFS